jgi:putative ABC transport system permease protein
MFVDSTFFDVFTCHFTNGNPAEALLPPNSVVLKKPVADKLFGAEDPIGKVILLHDANGKYNLTVTGVVDESLGKSHLQANLYIRMNPNGLGGDILSNTHWAINNFAWGYIKLRPGTDPGQLERQFPALLEKYGGQELKAFGFEKSIHLQPVTSIHTTAGFDAERGQPTSATFLSMLILIAAIIQIIACINFMNLSTARASQRAKEVGVRKVIGAGRKSLVFQFLGESLLITLIGVALALPLLLVCFPWLNELTHSDVSLSLLAGPSIWLMLGGIVMVTGILAGSYPAFYLSAFQSVKVIKGNFSNHISAAGIRRSLVVFQFMLSIVLITGIIIIHSQLNFIKNKDLGFSRDQQLVFTFHLAETKAKMPLLAEQLRRLPGIGAVSLSSGVPAQEHYYDWGVYLSGGNQAEAVDQQNISSDEYSLRALGIHLVSGRDFHDQDSGSTLINETLSRRLGLDPAKAPGTRLFMGDMGDARPLTIVGVMKDFNYKSLRRSIDPFMVIYNPHMDNIKQLIVRARTDDYQALLHQVAEVWKEVLPTTPFEYSFLNEEVGQLYTADVTLSNIINSFTLMAVIISCLGLFGLAAFSAEQRNKEIGIRKVLGASVGGIVRLLSKEFMRLVGLSLVLAIPIAWWVMHKWLEGFAYQVQLSWWMFALAGVLAVGIALVTVSFQAVRAALANPIKSLRSE